MSARARQVLLLGALLAAVVAKAQQPGPLFALGASPKAFPAELTVGPAPAPSADVYSDRPDIRVLQLLDSMNGLWERTFAAAGDEYERPTVETRGGERGEGCGSDVGGWAGIYCSRSRRIVIDVGDHEVHRALMGAGGTDDRLGYVLAHELGHHVQTLRNGLLRDTPEAVLRSELQAECLAGVWGRAAGRPLPPVWTYSSDADHGTAEQQRRWLELGHATGRPAACDAVWAD